MAKRVIFWESIDGSLHNTEEEAVDKDLDFIGEELYYENTLKKINDSYGECCSFTFHSIPETIVYRLIREGYTSLCFPMESNADSPEQYHIIVYKKGVEPKHNRRYIIDLDKIKT